MMIRRGLAVSALMAAMAMAGCSSLKGNKADEAAQAEAQAQQSKTEAAQVGGVDVSKELRTDDLAENAAAGGKKRTKGRNGQYAGAPDDSTVYFDYDSDRLSSDDLRTLKAHADFLKGNAKATVTVEGHTDERGTSEYNMALGERRAKAAQAFLVTHGVKGKQIDVVSFGETKPVDNDNSEEAWAKNRRVEITYQ